MNRRQFTNRAQALNFVIAKDVFDNPVALLKVSDGLYAGVLWVESNLIMRGPVMFDTGAKNVVYSRYMQHTTERIGIRELMAQALLMTHRWCMSSAASATDLIATLVDNTSVTEN